MSNIPIIQPEGIAEYSAIVCGMSTRSGGVSPPPLGMNLSFSVGDDEANVRTNREIFFGALHVSLDELAIPGQVHSATVRVAHTPGAYPECDALVTGSRRVFLCVSVADCVPILLYDARTNVVAAIHAGWRGTAGRIVMNAVAMMMEEFRSNPSDLIAFVGPCASACCYQVGGDVAAQFDHRFHHRKNGSTTIDLKAANVDQLIHAGVPPAAIEVSQRCTIHDSSALHSFRRDGLRSGRMMVTIGLAVCSEHV